MPPWKYMGDAASFNLRSLMVSRIQEDVVISSPLREKLPRRAGLFPLLQPIPKGRKYSLASFIWSIDRVDFPCL